MKFNGEYLWRVRVLSYPVGAFEPIDTEREIWVPVPGWRPTGWRPVGNYTQIMGTNEFVWPVTHHTYGSRTTAAKRANLLESYGATVVVERSSRIAWPDPDPQVSAVPA